MFIESSFINRGKEYLECFITRDGFSLLAMGFTGAKALKWKLKYIEAFNKMEAELKKQLAPTGKQLMVMALLEAKETMDKQVVLIDSLQKKVIEDEAKVLFADQLTKRRNYLQLAIMQKRFVMVDFKIGQNVSSIDFQIESLKVQT